MIISKLEFIHRSQLDQETLDIWLEEEWIVPREADDEPAFSEADLARAQLILELKQDLGVNDEGVGVILSLLDQVHSLRRVLAGTLQLMREQSAAPDAGNSTRQGKDRE
jgi:chaperone modulatory protein CbpM